jgi:hypothetical protein
MLRLGRSVIEGPAGGRGGFTSELPTDGWMGIAMLAAYQEVD